MKLIKTFIDGSWNGYQSMKEVVRLRADINRTALDKQKANSADHRVFAHYDIDKDGEVTAAWFYSDETYTDSEFDRIANITGIQVWALHARRFHGHK